MYAFTLRKLLLIYAIIFLDEIVVQFKFTVLLMPNGPHRITGLTFESDLYSSEYSIDDPELKVICLVYLVSFSVTHSVA